MKKIFYSVLSILCYILFIFLYVFFFKQNGLEVFRFYSNDPEFKEITVYSNPMTGSGYKCTKPIMAKRQLKQARNRNGVFYEHIYLPLNSEEDNLYCHPSGTITD